MSSLLATACPRSPLSQKWTGELGRGARGHLTTPPVPGPGGHTRVHVHSSSPRWECLCPVSRPGSPEAQSSHGGTSRAGEPAPASGLREAERGPGLHSLCRRTPPEAAPGGRRSGLGPSGRGAPGEPASVSVRKGVRAVRARGARPPTSQTPPGQRRADCQEATQDLLPTFPPRRPGKCLRDPHQATHLPAQTRNGEDPPRGTAQGHRARVTGTLAAELTAWVVLSKCQPDQMSVHSAPALVWASIPSARTLLCEIVTRTQGGNYSGVSAWHSGGTRWPLADQHTLVSPLFLARCCEGVDTSLPSWN